MREAKRPVIVFRALDNAREAPKKIGTIALALEGTRFSEKMVSYAAKAAQSLSARLTLIQALPIDPNLALLAEHEKSDILESSYLHRKAADIKAAHGIETQWEVATRQSRRRDLPLSQRRV